MYNIYLWRFFLLVLCLPQILYFMAIHLWCAIWYRLVQARCEIILNNVQCSWSRNFDDHVRTLFMISAVTWIILLVSAIIYSWINRRQLEKWLVTIITICLLIVPYILALDPYRCYTRYLRD